MGGTWPISSDGIVTLTDLPAGAAEFQASIGYHHVSVNVNISASGQTNVLLPMDESTGISVMGADENMWIDLYRVMENSDSVSQERFVYGEPAGARGYLFLGLKPGSYRVHTVPVEAHYDARKHSIADAADTFVTVRVGEFAEVIVGDVE